MYISEKKASYLTLYLKLYIQIKDFIYFKTNIYLFLFKNNLKLYFLR